MGVSFNEFVDHTCKHSRKTPGLFLGIENEYWVAMGSRAKNPQILVALPENISPEDTAKAYFHARLLDYLLVKHPSLSVEEAEARASVQMDRAWKAFRKSTIKSGWNFGGTELKTRGFEVALQPM